MAVGVSQCHEDVSLVRADAIAEPWEKNTKSFSNGKIRVAVLDTYEPAAASWHLLVISPSGMDEGDGRACHVVSESKGTGFGGIDFATLKTTYDTKKGLLLTFTYRTNIDGYPDKGRLAKIRINQATGQVSVER